MNMMENRSVVQLNCPSWCVRHTFDDDSGPHASGGVTVEHISAEVRWSDEPEDVAWLSRVDGYAGGLPQALHVAGQEIDVSSPAQTKSMIRLLERLAGHHEPLDAVDETEVDDRQWDDGELGGEA
jgi:hypothetical protein